MKKTILMAFAAASFCSFTACNNESKPEDTKEMAENANDKKFDDTKMENDAEWAVKSADGGMIEVELGKLAQSNGANVKVKEFGKMMVDDHTKANNELKELAMKKNITLPPALSESKQKDYDDMAKKTGADFDKAYTSYMVDDHQEDIDHYKKESNDGKDADIKAFATKTIPTLEHHLEMAKQAKDMVK